ncbi:MAG: hypothetical protein A2Y52_09520 [Sulfuricurvum sp. RIFCSPLOWO2_02_43_6]|nr:MAG: hypothetical protein A2Y52_09520 [Sulfuricurvum sp. RIFCSPLOWO2_02_43_6]
MVVIVTIEGKEYLCDTGFGGYGIREPLEVVDGNITVQNGDTFRFELLNGEYVLYSLVNGEWAPQYGFALVPQEWIEFSLANYFNATHPDTIFTQKKLAVMQTPNGRKILVDDTLKVIENGVIKEESIEYSQALSEYYNLSV